MTCEQLLQTQSFLDGEIQGAEAAQAESHLRGCAECQAFAAEIIPLSRVLRAQGRYQAPPHLRAAVRARLEREPRRFSPRNFWLGAGAGTGMSALAAALVLVALLPASLAGLGPSIATAHIDALTSGRTITVVSSNHHTVKPWLAAHAGLSPPVGDFADQGFALVGGRVDKVAGRTAAVMVYAHGKHELDLFAWVDHGGALPGPSTDRGFHVGFWKADGMDFAAVSDMDQAAFQKFISLARSQRE